MYGDLGFDFLQALKEAGAAGVTAAKSALLARGGQAIAASPEGQQAIRDTLVQRAQAKARQVGADVQTGLAGIPLPVWLGVGTLAFFYLRRRRR